MTTDEKRIRKTAVVVRGFMHIREFIAVAADDNAPPVATVVAKWRKAKQREFNAALDWLEQEEVDYLTKAALKPEPTEGGN